MVRIAVAGGTGLAQVVSWTRRGESAALPHGTCELAGPETQDLVDMARRTLAARGESLRLVPTWRGRHGMEVAGEVLLPGPDARIAPTTFDDWLTTQTGSGSQPSIG